MKASDARNIVERAKALGAKNVYSTPSHTATGELRYYVAFNLNGTQCGPTGIFGHLDRTLALIEKARRTEWSA